MDINQPATPQQKKDTEKKVKFLITHIFEKKFFFSPLFLLTNNLLKKKKDNYIRFIGRKRNNLHK